MKILPLIALICLAALPTDARNYTVGEVAEISRISYDCGTMFSISETSIELYKRGFVNLSTVVLLINNTNNAINAYNTRMAELLVDDPNVFAFLKKEHVKPPSSPFALDTSINEDAIRRPSARYYERHLS